MCSPTARYPASRTRLLDMCPEVMLSWRRNTKRGNRLRSTTGYPKAGYGLSAFSGVRACAAEVVLEAAVSSSPRPFLVRVDTPLPRTPQPWLRVELVGSDSLSGVCRIDRLAGDDVAVYIQTVDDGRSRVVIAVLRECDVFHHVEVSVLISVVVEREADGMLLVGPLSGV